MWFPQPSVTRIVLDQLAAPWGIWLPCTVLIIGLGWYQRRLWSGRLLLLTVALLVAVGVSEANSERSREKGDWAAWDARRVTLREPVVLDGLRLPSGTAVRWNSEDPTHVVTADLLDDEEIAPGTTLRGEIVFDDYWSGTLAHDASLRGWLCRAGKVDLYSNGLLRWCVAAAKKLPAGDVPEGTAVLLDKEGDGALLHLIGRGMTLLPLQSKVSAGQWFYVDANGDLASTLEQ